MVTTREKKERRDGKESGVPRPQIQLLDPPLIERDASCSLLKLILSTTAVSSYRIH